MVELKEKIKLLPNTPGVYLMKDSLDNIIYVGKSKDLKKRVNSYFYDKEGRSSKIDKLVKNAKDLDHITCDTEFDALLLECSLIMKYKPRYNKLMANHEKYPYLKVTGKEKYPRIEVAFQKQDEGSLYFGPFNNYNRMITIKTILDEEFKLKTCSVKSFDTVYPGCLNYQLSKCFGPCKGEDAREEYLNNIDSLIKLLECKDYSLVRRLQNQMEEAAEREDFVKAIKIRDKLKEISYLCYQLENLSECKLNKKIVLMDLIQENVYKLYYIRGLKIVDKEIVTMEASDTLFIEEKAKKVFEQNHREILLNKEAIDSINIISSYIKKNKDKIFYVQ